MSYAADRIVDLVRNARSNRYPAAGDMLGGECGCGCGWTWTRCFFCGEYTFDPTMAPRRGSKLRDACMRCADSIARER